MKKHFSIVLVSFLTASLAFGANATRFKDVVVNSSVKIGGSALAQSSAALEVSSTTKGMLPPRMTTTQRDAIGSPATGLLIFNTTTGKNNYYNGSAWAEVGSGSGGTSAGILSNPGWESGTANWTASGGTYTTTATFANVGSGLAAASWDSNGAGQTLTSDGVAIPAGLYGKNGAFFCSFQTPTGTATHTIKVTDGTNTLNTLSVTSSATYVKTGSTFVFPSSGSVYLVVTSVAADEPLIYVDDCYVGTADGTYLTNVNPITAWTTYTPTFTNFGTVTSTYAKWRRVGDTMEVQASFQLGTTVNDNAAISLPSGYSIGAPTLSTGMSVGTWSTSTSGTPGGIMFIATGATTNVNFGSAGDVALSGFEPLHGASLGAATASVAVMFTVPIPAWGTSSQLAVTPDQAIKYAVGTFTAGSADFTTTSASYAAASIANLYGARSLFGSASACSDGNALCVKYPNMPAGDWNIEFRAPAHYNAANTLCHYEIHDGADVSTSDARIFTDMAGIVSGPVSSKTTKNYASTADREFVIKAKRSSGSGTCYVAGTGASSYIAIYPANSPSPAPLLVGSVTSSSAGLERIERASITGGNPPTISSQSGTWLTYTSRTGVGDYTFTMAGFSSTPTCVTAPMQTSDPAVYMHQSTVYSVSATTLRYVQNNTADGGTVSSDELPTTHVICMGPR